MKTYVHLRVFFLQWRLFSEEQTEVKETTDHLNVPPFNYRKPDILAFARDVQETTFRILRNSSNRNGKRVKSRQTRFTLKTPMTFAQAQILFTLKCT
jgi:hypothetical protein